MDKNPTVVGLSKKQQRTVKSLAGGKLIGLSVRTVASKHSIRFVACRAPFLACKNYDVVDSDGVTHCHNPFPQCKEYSCRGKA